MEETKDNLRWIVISANVIGLIYNIPQTILTIRTKSANDISLLFISLRLLSSFLWIVYTMIHWLPDVFISWIITGTSSSILLYYKIRYSTSEQLFIEFSFFFKKNDAVELKDEPQHDEKPAANVEP
jgi:uncharacterized protein with PQ loop repeat